MMERTQIITLTLSPARDLTIEAGTIDLGTSHRVSQAKGRLGGKGINVARVLAALGRSAYVQGPVNAADWPESAGSSSDGPGPMSADSAAEAQAHASMDSDAGMVWDLTATPSHLRRSYALVEKSGRATLFNEQASEHPAEVWEEIEAKLRARLAEPRVRVLAISGSTPSDLPDGFFDRVIAAAHEAGVRVIVDTSGPALITAAKAGADWLKPNHEELAELAELVEQAGSASPPTDASAASSLFSDDTAGLVAAGASELINAGAGAVLVSRGEEGVVFVDRTGPRSTARLDAPVQGNPTGAGDAVVAALLHRVAQRADSEPQESPRLSAAASDRLDADTTATRIDTGGDDVLTRAEVEEILTDAVAISAAAVLMPQAGAIHPSWDDLRDRVQIIGPDGAPEANVGPNGASEPEPKVAPIPTSDDPGE